MARGPVLGEQHSRPDRQRGLFHQRRRLPNADQERPGAARPSLFQRNAEVRFPPPQAGGEVGGSNTETTMDQRNFTSDYDTLLEMVKTRVSVRNLKSDPIPDDNVTRILEVGRWAMS